MWIYYLQVDKLSLFIVLSSQLFEGCQVGYVLYLSCGSLSASLGNKMVVIE